MGSMKEQFFEMQEQRADEWITENYPKAEEGTEDWEHAAQEYSWYRDYMDEQAKRLCFQDSLHDLGNRHRHAMRELDELQALLASPQPGIVMSLAYVHTVTVMESFLMYSARALLNNTDHLERFYSLIAPRFKKPIALCDKTVLENTQRNNEGIVVDEVGQRRRAAQLFISQQTFHNIDNIKRYFDEILITPPLWPLDTLRHIVSTRQDLAHRNGVTKYDDPVYIGTLAVTDAITTVRSFVEVVASTLQREWQQIQVISDDNEGVNG